MTNILSMFDDVSRMTLLPDVFDSHGIKSQKALVEAVRGEKELKLGERTVRIARPGDLLFGPSTESSCLVSNQSFDHEWVIFDCDVTVHCPSTFKVENCVFLGSLDVTLGLNSPGDIGMRCVAVCQKLTIDGRHIRPGKGDFELRQVRASRIGLWSLRASGVVLDSVACENLDLYGVVAEGLSVFGSKIGSLLANACHFERSTFASEQVEVGNSLGVGGKKRPAFDALQFPAWNRHWWQEGGGGYARHGPEEVGSTVSFLRDYTDAARNRKTWAEARYAETLAQTQGAIARGFVRATGAFLKPWYFAVWSAAIILLFGCIYSIFPVDSIRPCVRSFWEALYFSGITFSTVGYGDHAPVGWLEPFAVTEALLGIVLSSSFVVALTRRYVD
jgi:hypothetical protein